MLPDEKKQLVSIGDKSEHEKRFAYVIEKLRQ